jgi:DNA-binding transcriptional ArsR family regulator
VKRLLWWLLAGSRGGRNRADILARLKDRPYNAHQLSEALGLDYKTIRHHLKILEENQCIASSGKDQYGAMYFLTGQMEQNWPIFEEILAKIAPDSTKRSPATASGAESAAGNSSGTTPANGAAEGPAPGAAAEERRRPR